MHIALSSQVDDKTLSIKKSGDTLIINGEPFDFSAIPDGATLPASAVDCEFVVGDVERVDGDLQLTLMLPIGIKASQAACFPQPLVNPPDGDLELPQ
jgi:hypothetical protein